MKRGPKLVSPEIRFWRHVDKRGDCWLWTGYRNEKGYGHFVPVSGRSPVKAQRFAYQLAKGLIPPGLCVCHRCDTPACVRVEHLFLGTIADNNRDMIAKGRHRAVPRHSHCQRGHPMTPDNTYVKRGGRRCKTCLRAAAARWRRRTAA